MSPDRRAPADAHLPSHIITSFARRNAVERNATMCCTWRRRPTLEAFMQLFLAEQVDPPPPGKVFTGRPHSFSWLGRVAH